MQAEQPPISMPHRACANLQWKDKVYADAESSEAGRRESRTATATTDEPRKRLQHHILPVAGTMLGICTTLIGLVKILETRIGPSRVDEYGGAVGVLFLFSALASYAAIRLEEFHLGSSQRFERVADICFVAGLLRLTILALFFAYELV